MSNEEGYPEVTQSSRTVYRGRIVNLRVDTVRLPDGRTSEREIVEHRGAVAIAPVDDHDNIYLVRQFRKPIESYAVEIPAGTRDPDEDVLTCLRRELREETGLTAGRIDRLIGYYSAVGFCTEYIDIYLATQLSAGAATPDSDEDLDVLVMPVSEALSLLKDGQIVDAKTIIALLTLQAMRMGPK